MIDTVLDPTPIAFRPLATGDLPLLHGWLNNPRVYRWYGGAASSFAKIETEYAPNIAGQALTRSYLILYANTPIGYIQSYPVNGYPESIALIGDEPGAAGIDLFIGDDAYALQGLGAASVRAFLRQVIFADPGTTHCFIDPYPENVVAIRAYTRAGFRPLRRIEPPPPAEPCLLMRIERADVVEAQ